TRSPASAGRPRRCVMPRLPRTCPPWLLLPRISRSRQRSPTRAARSARSATTPAPIPTCAPPESASRTARWSGSRGCRRTARSKTRITAAACSRAASSQSKGAPQPPVRILRRIHMSLSVVVRRFAATAAASALVAAIGSLLHAQAPAPNNPPLTPRSILVFPQRDFVSASGFAEGDVVTVEVFHPGSTVAASTAPGVIPQDDPATPGFDGIVEVNHPGGACWANVTPDIRPGDRVRTVRKDAFGAILGIDETTIANVVAKRPVQTAPDTVVIR